MPLVLNPGTTTTLLSAAVSSNFAVSALFQVTANGSVTFTGTQNGAFQALVYSLQIFDITTGKHQPIASWDVLGTGGTLTTYLTAGPYYQLVATSFASSGGFNSTITGAPAAVSPTQTIASLPAGAALIGKVGIDQTTPGTTNAVQVAAALPTGANTIGSVKLTDGTNTAAMGVGTTKTQLVSLHDGTTLVGVIGATTALKTDKSSVAGATIAVAGAGTQKVGIVGNTAATLDAAIGGVAPTNALWQTNAPSTAAAASCSLGNAVSLTVLNIKASAGNVYGITVVNKAATVIYLQFYNTAGAPVLGTSVISWIPVPASGTLIIPPSALAILNLATGIGIGASTTPTSTGTPATAPDVTVWFK